MTRDQREQEIERLILTNVEDFFALYRKAAGLPPGSKIPNGLPVKPMIQLILDWEFDPATRQKPR